MAEIALDLPWLEEYFEYEIRRLQKVVENHKRSLSIAEGELHIAVKHDMSERHIAEWTNKVKEAEQKLGFVEPRLSKLAEQYQIVRLLLAKS